MTGLAMVGTVTIIEETGPAIHHRVNVGGGVGVPLGLGWVKRCGGDLDQPGAGGRGGTTGAIDLDDKTAGQDSGKGSS